MNSKTIKIITINMSLTELVKLQEESSIQKAERLVFIDFRLRFLGSLNRSDLKEQFGIADAAASKELSEYKKLRPNNFSYDRVLRANTIVEAEFVPLVNISAETALGMLANGFNKNMLRNDSMVPYQRVGIIPNKLNPDIVSKVTRAMHGKYALNCHYISATSNNHDERLIYPTALFYDGQSWMFRAFHPGTDMFKCFNLSRIAQANESPYTKAKPHECLEADSDWFLTVPMELKLHPSLSQSQKVTVRKDFGVADDESTLLITEKAALVYFLIQNWKVDVKNKPSREKNYNFHLKNSDSLRCIKSIENIFKG